MTRKLTDKEETLLRKKAKDWSWCEDVENEVISLGNGVDEEPTAYLEVSTLMREDVSRITISHVTLAN